MGSLGGGRVQELSVVCLHDNTIVARGILVTILHCEITEPRLSAIYIVSSVGTSLSTVRTHPLMFIELRLTWPHIHVRCLRRNIH